ncbi:MAG: DinB family protein [Bacteroidota bacterium]
MNLELADFSLVVRESSVKRFSKVPLGMENWQYQAGKMSFADLAFHLVECDQWMLDMVGGNPLPPITQSRFQARSRGDFETLLGTLHASGERRRSFIQQCSPDIHDRRIYDPRVNKEVTLWWFIVRGNLDHEIHHRGQVAILLNLCTPPAS